MPSWLGGPSARPPGPIRGVVVLALALRAALPEAAHAQGAAPPADTRPAAETGKGGREAAKDGDKDKPDEPDEPDTKALEITGVQCEALALGRTIKDVPPDSKVEQMRFTTPPPVSFQLPEQSRQALTECALRASGLSVRVDRARNKISLLPSGAYSPELPNPRIKVTVKLAVEAAKEPP